MHWNMALVKYKCTLLLLLRYYNILNKAEYAEEKQNIGTYHIVLQHRWYWDWAEVAVIWEELQIAQLQQYTIGVYKYIYK